MPHLSVSTNSQSKCCPVWLLCVILSLSAVHAHATDVLSVPQQLSLSANVKVQQLSISWLGGAATTFDLIILRTELNTTAFYGTVSVPLDQVSGLQRWNWTSAEPLECTSLSVKVRSRDGEKTSEWSNIQYLQGNDLPSKEQGKLYPQNHVVVPVGANTTFCCIVKEGQEFGSIHYGDTVMEATRLSRRSYATTVVNQGASRSSGTNVVCFDSLNTIIDGVVAFVGYPPLLRDFACETQDLTSAVCQWNVRDPKLFGRRRTKYTLNSRNCLDENEHVLQKKCAVPQWEGNWTLLAVNPLGQYSLTDSAELSHRVHPVAPNSLSVNAHAWTVTVHWQWKYSGYLTLGLVCQVELTSQGSITNFTVSGVGLQSAALSGLYPDEDHSVQVRCGAQPNFWKWGSWSKPLIFKTKTFVPDPPDLWMWINKDKTGQVVWKPLTHRQSHGQITGYEVTVWSSEENIQHTHTFPPDATAAPVDFTQIVTLGNDTQITATVIAKSSKGSSQPASVVFHLTEPDTVAVSRTVYENNGFRLSWQSDANTTSDYVVEWHDSACSRNCSVEWIKVATGITNVTVDSPNFQPGVRYTFSLYSVSSEGRQLRQRWQGFVQELVPSSSVLLSTSQRGTDVVLTWSSIPQVNHRGFLLGYNVYNSSGSELKLIANLTDKEIRSYTVKGLSEGSHKFTVKAYTSAGEDSGATASITLESYIDWLILELLTSLGVTALFLIIVTFFCYKKRKWVKRAFYPDIPEPKLPGDWSRTQGPLDVKPSSHSIIQIVQKPDQDSSKEMLVVIPEEDEDEEEHGMGDEPVDTDEPASIRYYNQVIDERPIRPRYPDSSTSSASSLDSGRTDVTYTGIQTSGSSLVFQLHPAGSSEDQQPPVDVTDSCSGGGGGGGYRPQCNNARVAPHELFNEPQAAASGGYKPQSSWHLDSPIEAGDVGGLAPSLGSPTSIASTQFLLPDGEQHQEEKRQASSSASTWFTNLLSSSKP